MMKAIVYAEHGGPEVLKYVDRVEPVTGAGEVLVRVRACALNHLDLWLRKGIPSLNIPLPHIPGSDLAGEVTRLGTGVTNLKVGQRVMLQPGISCGQCEKCMAGDDNLCRSYRILGEMVDGGCAEYLKAPAVNCVPIPEGVSFEAAAAFPLVSLTAWHMLITRAKLKPAEAVLVLEAASGGGAARFQTPKL